MLCSAARAAHSILLLKNCLYIFGGYLKGRHYPSDAWVADVSALNTKLGSSAGGKSVKLASPKYITSPGKAGSGSNGPPGKDPLQLLPPVNQSPTDKGVRAGGSKRSSTRGKGRAGSGRSTVKGIATSGSVKWAAGMEEQTEYVSHLWVDHRRRTAAVVCNSSICTYNCDTTSCLTKALVHHM